MAFDPLLSGTIFSILANLQKLLDRIGCYLLKELAGKILPRIPLEAHVCIQNVCTHDFQCVDFFGVQIFLIMFMYDFVIPCVLFNDSDDFR